MALALLTGDQREDQAIAAGAAVGAVLASAELALAAAISSAAWKAALGRKPSLRSLERQLAVILAVAELKAGRAIPPPVPDTVTRAIAAASGQAYASALSAYEQAAAAAGPPGGAASLPRILAAQRVLDDLLGKGITGFTDRAGRNWDLASYAEMAARTGVSNAIDDRLSASLQAQGLDLVLVTHGSEPACASCAPYIGRLLSLSGSTLPGSYPIEDASGGFRSANVVATLASAKAHGFRHPNCRCSLSGWSDGADFTASDSFTPPPAHVLAARYAAEQARRAAQRGARDAARRQRLAMTPQARTRAMRDAASAALSHHRARQARAR